MAFYLPETMLLADDGRARLGSDRALSGAAGLMRRRRL